MDCLRPREEHWCKGASSIELPWGNAYCAWGALHEASIDLAGMRRPAFGPAEVALQAAANARGYTTAAGMNDDARTTHAMVLDAMYEAADIARDQALERGLT